MLQGCAQSPVIVPAARPVLPSAPGLFGAPVKGPAITAGLDARALAARERAALIEANMRLRADSTFYKSVTSAY